MCIRDSVYADHVALVVKEALSQRLRQLRLAHARRAQEEEAAYRPVRVGDAGARALDGLGHEPYGLVLAHDALVDDLVQVQQLLALALDELRDGDAGPFGDDAGYLLLRHGCLLYTSRCV